MFAFTRQNGWLQCWGETSRDSWVSLDAIACFLHVHLRQVSSQPGYGIVTEYRFLFALRPVLLHMYDVIIHKILEEGKSDTIYTLSGLSVSCSKRRDTERESTFSHYHETVDVPDRVCTWGALSRLEASDELSGMSTWTRTATSAHKNWVSTTVLNHP